MKIHALTALAAVFLAAGAAQAAPRKAATPAATGPVATQPRAPTAPAGPPIAHGPVLPGVCAYYDERAVGGSSAGQAANTRMQQLRAQIAAELQAEQTGIQTDGAALSAKRATMTPEAFAQAAAPIQQRGQALEAKAQLRQRELEATGAKASQRIHQVIDGSLRQAYQSHNCSLLLNGDAGLYLINPAMDLTPQVISSLNAALPTISFDREVLPAQGGAAQ